MRSQSVADAMKRVESALLRRPDMGLHDDAPATARWNGATRVVASHANGTHVSTDMPAELGGEVLRALVEESCRCSPIPNAVRIALPVALRIDIATADGANPRG